ncbi:MAG: hypothetical protein PHQ43_12085 [Dehalococcoidales bacterium]|nr:hypothetical protein [Dehalococcoidales bacterium]
MRPEEFLQAYIECTARKITGRKKSKYHRYAIIWTIINWDELLEEFTKILANDKNEQMIVSRPEGQVLEGRFTDKL